MIRNAFKSILPDHAVAMRVWRGPFRGAQVMMNPRHSLRKIFGLYEHELNDWLEQALGRVTQVVDVGANDGYFTFGSAAAFRRLGKKGEVISLDPQKGCVDVLRASLDAQRQTDMRFEIIQTLVGRETREGMTTLDALSAKNRRDTLVKIDVEGAEVDVIEGARSWMNPSNLFLIEVHQEAFLSQLKRIFDEAGLPLVQMNQRPLRWLGRETRVESNWWLVSDLSRNHSS